MPARYMMANKEIRLNNFMICLSSQGLTPLNQTSSDSTCKLVKVRLSIGGLESSVHVV